MNTPAVTPQVPELALLILDASGTVRAANDAAGQLWQTQPVDLAGQTIVSLFVFEVASDAPGWFQAQWDALKATALGQPLEMLTQPFTASTPVAVTVELQTAHGPDSVYFARIEVCPARPQVETATLDPVIRGTPNLAQDTHEPSAFGSNLLSQLGPLGFFDLDLRTGQLTTSPAWKRMLGYAADELPDTHATWRGLIHPDDTAALPDRVVKPPLTAHREFSIECRLRHRLGHYCWVHSAGIQLFGADRTLIRVLGINTDIQERKEAEEIGLISENRLACLDDTGGLAVFDLDFATGQHWFAPACAPLLAAGEGTPTLATFLKTLPAAATESGIELFLTNLGADESFLTRTLPLRMPDGREIPALLGIQRLWSRKRTLLRTVGFILPLPKGTGAMPPALLNDMLDSISEAVIVTDERTQILYLNAKASRLTGFPLSEARTCKLNEVMKLVHAKTSTPDDTAIDLALCADEKPRLHTEHALLAPTDAQPRPLLWSLRKIESPSGGIVGAVMVFRDPTEMTLTLEERIRANRFESLGQLASGISHDFNNLLATILGGISSAKDNRDYTHLQDAERACLEAKALTRQLLTFAKGGVSAAHQVIATAEILQDAVRLAAAGTTAVITVEVPDAVAPIQVDRGQIIQVFQNLIINAIQAMPVLHHGRIKLLAQNVRLADQSIPNLPAGEYVQIQVQDNGSGIHAEHLDKIFESFYTTKSQGTGLGLSTVRSIVRQHGGQITVTSQFGHGTTFTLFFPQAEQAAAPVVRVAPSLRFGTGRILVLEDDLKIGQLTGGMLASLDYTYDLVRTGEDALTFYRRYLNIGRPYDVVILDLNIVGGMGGEECFKQLQVLKPDVRAIVNSGYDSAEMGDHFQALGFAGYLTKPYRVGDLARTLRSVLGKT